MSVEARATPVCHHDGDHDDDDHDDYYDDHDHGGPDYDHDDDMNAEEERTLLSR